MQSQWSHSQCLVLCNNQNFEFDLKLNLPFSLAMLCFGLSAHSGLPPFIPIWHFCFPLSLITTISYPARIELRGNRRSKRDRRVLPDQYNLRLVSRSELQDASVSSSGSVAEHLWLHVLWNGWCIFLKLAIPSSACSFLSPLLFLLPFFPPSIFPFSFFFVCLPQSDPLKQYFKWLQIKPNTPFLLCQHTCIFFLNKSWEYKQIIVQLLPLLCLVLVSQLFLLSVAV